MFRTLQVVGRIVLVGLVLAFGYLAGLSGWNTTTDTRGIESYYFEPSGYKVTGPYGAYCTTESAYDGGAPCVAVVRTITFTTQERGEMAGSRFVVAVGAGLGLWALWTKRREIAHRFKNPPAR